MRSGPVRRLGSRSRWRLLALLLLFLAVRLLQAASATETETFDFEEAYTVTAAWELLHHGDWPLSAYQYSDWEGGSLVMVLLTAPFCFWLGPCLFTLTAAALCVSGLAFVMLYRLVERAYGWRAAVLASSLYLLSPDPILGYSLTAKGFHPDSVALQLLFLHLAIGEGHSPRRRRFWLGLLTGFGTYFAYVFALTPLAWALSRLGSRRGVTGRSRPPGGIAPFLAGLVLGASPLVAFNLARPLAGLTIHGEPLWRLLSPVHVLHGLGRLSPGSVAALWRFAEPEGLASMAALAYVAVFWLAALGSLVLGRDREGMRHAETAAVLDRFVVGYVVLYSGLIVVVVSRYPLAPYHLVPLLVVLLMRIGDRAVVMWDRRHLAQRLGAAAIAASLLGLGLVANARLVRLDLLGASLRIDARDPLQFASGAAEADPSRARRFAALEARLPAELGDDTPIADRFLRSAPADLLAGGSAGDRARDVSFLTGYGLGLWRRQHLDDPGRVRAHLARHGVVARDPLLQGYGYALCPLDDCPPFDGWEDAPEEGRRWVAFGLGRAVPLSRFLDSKGQLLLEALPVDLRSAAVEGLGYELGLRLLRPFSPSMARAVPASFRPAFWEGVAEGTAARNR